MQKSHPKLNPFILARACLRARLIDNPAEADSYAEPRGLVARLNDRTDAARAAEEAYAMALALLGGFGPNWTADLDDVIANDEIDDLAWHERLVLAIEQERRIEAIEALAHLQWLWGRHFHDDHGWVRSLARHVQRLADWVLRRPPSVG